MRSVGYGGEGGVEAVDADDVGEPLTVSDGQGIAAAVAELARVNAALRGEDGGA
jgi:hypothetical protein